MANAAKHRLTHGFSCLQDSICWGFRSAYDAIIERRWGLR